MDFAPHNRIAGYFRDLDEMLEIHTFPDPDPGEELLAVLSERQPLHLWMPLPTLSTLVIDNLTRLRRYSARPGLPPEVVAGNAALVRQREALLEVLAGHPESHLFVALVPVNPFAEEGDEPEAWTEGD